MEPAQLAELARLIAAEGLEPSSRFYVIQMVVVALSLIAGAFLNAYASKRGEIAANRDQFDELKKQLRETTQLSEEIKSAVSFEEWALKDKRDLRRRKLEELCLASYSSFEWLSAYREKAVDSATEGKAISQRYEMDSPIHKVLVVGGLYFPELRADISKFSVKHQKHVARLSKLSMDLLVAKSNMAANPRPNNAKTNAEVLAEARPQLVEQLGELYKDLLSLNNSAQSLMDSIAVERPK